jgi:hypothetical protein
MCCSSSSSWNWCAPSSRGFTDGFYQLSKFLVIGVIASVRHILSVGSSLTLDQGKSTEEFQRAILELGVNAGVVLALVFAIVLVRRAENDRKPTPR